jgi:F-box/leucine-rich repeat protein 14
LVVARLGPDYFGDIKMVLLGPQTNDEVMRFVGRLGGLEALQALGELKQVSDAGMVHVRGLTRLRSLRFGLCPKLTAACLVNVSGLTNLEALQLGQTTFADADLAQLKGLTRLVLLNLDSGGV